MQKLGIEEIDVIVVDLNFKKEKILNVALNKISGEWDKDKLIDLMKELENEEIDLLETGFTEKEIEKLLKEIDIEEPDIEFTDEWLEAHNYVILYFDNEIDWQTAIDKLGIKSKHALDSREGYERVGIGRVIKGSDVLDRL